MHITKKIIEINFINLNIYDILGENTMYILFERHNANLIFNIK